MNPPFNTNTMEIANLVHFIRGCNQYKKRIRRIRIATTEDMCGKQFNNFRYSVIFNVGYMADIFWEPQNGNEAHLTRKCKLWNEAYAKMVAKLYGSRYSDYIQVDCDDETETVIKMGIVYDAIVKHVEIKPELHFKGEDYESIREIEWEVKKIKKERIEDLKAEIRKEYVLMDVKLAEARFTFTRLMRTLQSKKQTYILGKLMDGELTQDDIKQYPDLIKLTDELQKIKIMVGMR